MSRSRSWVEIPPGCDFTLENLPYGIFRPPGGGMPRVGVAIGERVVDLAALADRGLLEGPPPGVFRAGRLNDFLAQGRPTWERVRARLQELLSAGCPELRDQPEGSLWAQAEVELLLPVEVGDFVDFYSSQEHASNVGTMFRGPENALPVNWKHLPIGYHGRASTLIPSGEDVIRPWGQLRPDPAAPPLFAPTRRLDFELEVGAVIGRASSLGQPVPVAAAEDHVFGLVLVNDWSARDIQAWEYVPLGPFLGKSFATSVSPWVVPLAALEPFRTEGPTQDVELLPHLRTEGPRTFDLTLEVWLEPRGAGEPARITRTNFQRLYWNMAQQIAHLTSNGTSMRVGDLYASGTVSGPTRAERGSMLELSWGGKEPLDLPGGIRRSFLEDGDRLIFRAFADRGGLRVGFGELTSVVLPALLRP